MTRLRGMFPSGYSCRMDQVALSDDLSLCPCVGAWAPFCVSLWRWTINEAIMSRKLKISTWCRTMANTSIRLVGGSILKPVTIISLKFLIERRNWNLKVIRQMSGQSVLNIQFPKIPSPQTILQMSFFETGEAEMKLILIWLTLSQFRGTRPQLVFSWGKTEPQMLHGARKVSIFFSALKNTHPQESDWSLRNYEYQINRIRKAVNSGNFLPWGFFFFPYLRDRKPFMPWVFQIDPSILC